ncbi:MAG: carbohydrate-binding domain-containing protein [Candidatus Aminicenantales bacterium]
MGRTMLLSSRWTPVVIHPGLLEEGEHTLSVEFTNDYYNPRLKQDRNVWLGDVEVLELR